MGYIRHHAIVVTGQRWSESVRNDDRNTEIDDAHRAAIEAGCRLVSEIVGPGVNRTYSFLVAPDGNKEGWAESDEGDAARDRFVAWLREHSPKDAGWFAWAEVVLGSDDDEALIERHAWDGESSAPLNELDDGMSEPRGRSTSL